MVPRCSLNALGKRVSDGMSRSEKNSVPFIVQTLYLP